MERIISHHIIFEGSDFGLSVAEFSDDRLNVNILPFGQEMHSTAWVDGPVYIIKDDDGRYLWTRETQTSLKNNQN